MLKSTLNMVAYPTYGSLSSIWGPTLNIEKIGVCPIYGSQPQILGTTLYIGAYPIYGGLP